MNTPRHRFTVMPLCVALLTALAWLPATSVVKVNAHGLGLEHEQPWRRPAHERLARLADQIRMASRHVHLRAAIAAVLITAYALYDPQVLYLLPIVFGITLTEGMHSGEFLAWETHPAVSREALTVLSGQNLLPGAALGRVNRGVGRMTVPAVVGTGNGTVSLVFGGPETLVGNYVATCITAAANGGTFSVVNPAGKALPNAVVATPYRSREINFTINDGATDFIVGDSFTFVVDTTAPTVVGTGNGAVSAITLGPDSKHGNYRLEITAAVANGGEFKLTSPDGDIVEQGFIVAGAGGTFVGANKRQINFTLTEGATDFAVGDAFNILVFNQLNGGKAVAWDPTTFDGRQVGYGVLLHATDASAADKAGVAICRDAIVLKSALQFGAAITAAQRESFYRDLAARNVIARDSVV